MEITDEIRDAHKRLSQCSATYIDYVERNPHIVDRSLYKKVMALDFDLLNSQPWPAFVDSRMRRSLEEASKDVFRLVKSLPQRIFGNDAQKIGEYLHIPPGVVEGLLDGVTPEHLNRLMGRGDFLFSPSGLKCLEYNVSASVGGWFIAFIEPVLLNEPIITGFLEESGVKIRNKSLIVIFFEHILEGVVKKYPASKEINVAVAIPRYGKDPDNVVRTFHHLDETFRDTLRRQYPQLDGQIFFGDYPQMDIVDNRLFIGGKKIHALVELYLGEVPPDVMEVFKAGNILLYDGPIAPLLSNKLFIALLSEHEDSDLFSPGERETIKKYIPWSRKAVPGGVTFHGDSLDMAELLVSNRENLVLKPGDGLGGESVCVGRHTSAPLWKEMVKVALRNKNWLVQEYVESLPFLYLTGDNDCRGHDVVWGVFIFGGHYAGTCLRVLPKSKNVKGVINASLGAETAVMFEVDE